MVHDRTDVIEGPGTLDQIAVRFDEQRLVSDAGLLLTGSLGCWAPVNLGMKRASRAVHGGDEPVAAQDGVGVVLVGVQHE